MYRDRTAKDYMDTIDEWISYELPRRKFKPTKDAYADVFFELTTKLGIKQYVEPLEKLKKVATLLGGAVGKQRNRKKMGLTFQSIEEILA